MTLEEARKKIKPLDEEKMETARKRWDSIAKPLHSLGKMEDLITQIVGITGEVKVDIGKKALVAMCADNGVVEEGVTQTGQEVTGIVADNFVKETTTACVMCHQCGVAVKPVDVGMVKDTTARTDLKVMYGTRNMTKGPAMTREEAVKGIEAGIAMAEELKAQGYRLLATGEMGIGNTTTSSAVASVLLDQPVETMTGRGAGLSSDGLTRKINAIKKACQGWRTGYRRYGRGLSWRSRFADSGADRWLYLRSSSPCGCRNLSAGKRLYDRKPCLQRAGSASGSGKAW